MDWAGGGWSGTCRPVHLSPAPSMVMLTPKAAAELASATDCAPFVPKEYGLSCAGRYRWPAAGRADEKAVRTAGVRHICSPIS